MVLYIQERDYTKGINQGRGMRMFIHPYGTQPFVEESGLSVATGFSTFIGLRQVDKFNIVILYYYTSITIKEYPEFVIMAQ